MDENPDRRVFLDKLLGYMDELRKPVTACPTISKQPLDLFKLYVFVKERGGFMEVCKVNFAATLINLRGVFIFEILFLIRLPKVKHGKMLQDYWVLEQVVVQLIR